MVVSTHRGTRLGLAPPARVSARRKHRVVVQQIGQLGRLGHHRHIRSFRRAVCVRLCPGACEVGHTLWV